MRVELRFKISELPIGYRLGVLSIIKEMIRLGSESYYQEIFEKKKSSLKPFVYSTYIKNISIQNNKITGDELIVTVSTPSYEWMMHLVNGSRKSKSIYIGIIFSSWTQSVCHLPTALLKSVSPFRQNHQFYWNPGTTNLCYIPIKTLKKNFNILVL